MTFGELMPGARGQELTSAILDGLARVYEENVARYDPDGVGDDATTFGLTVARNLWHVLEVAVQDVEGVDARRAHNTFFLVIDGKHELYFCKAPPGKTSVRAVPFEDSYVRGQIIRRNGDHVQLRIDVENETAMPVLNAAPAPYAVIVHFGDPEEGFERAVVGAPYRLAAGDFGWEWEHPLEREGDEPGAGQQPTELRPDPNAHPSGFGLKLRVVEDQEQAGEGQA